MRYLYGMYVYAFRRRGGDGAAVATAAAMVSHSKRNSRHFSRRCRVSRDDGARYFSPIRVYTRSRANTLPVSLRAAIGMRLRKVDTRDLRTLQAINISATDSALTIRPILSERAASLHFVISSQRVNAKTRALDYSLLGRKK